MATATAVPTHVTKIAPLDLAWDRADAASLLLDMVYCHSLRCFGVATRAALADLSLFALRWTGASCGSIHTALSSFSSRGAIKKWRERSPSTPYSLLLASRYLDNTSCRCRLRPRLHSFSPSLISIPFQLLRSYYVITPTRIIVQVVSVLQKSSIDEM